eukprot:Pgem_evm1s6875
MNNDGWSCCVQISEPEIVKKVHLLYLRAGADIIIANTYASNRNVLEPAKMGEYAKASNYEGVRLAKEAVKEYKEEMKLAALDVNDKTYAHLNRLKDPL